MMRDDNISLIMKVGAAIETALTAENHGCFAWRGMLASARHVTDASLHNVGTRSKSTAFGAGYFKLDGGGLGASVQTSPRRFSDFSTTFRDVSPQKRAKLSEGLLAWI